MKNILKMVFLGVIGFGILVYLTAPTPPQKETKKEYTGKMTLDSFPRFFDVISKSEFTKFDEIFKNKRQYLVVLNHDSLAVFKDLYKYSNKDFVLVANVANTPWLIKKLAVDDKLKDLFKASTIPLINDDKGLISNILNVDSKSQNAYTVFEINEKKEITKLFSASVKLNALQDGISNDEIETTLKEFLSKL